MPEQEPKSDRRSNKFEKIIIAAFSAIVLTPYAMFYAGAALQKKVDKNVKQYVESNLGKIIKEQEERLGIKHFGTPEISHENPPARQHYGPFVRGEYIAEEDKIFLPLGNAITPEQNTTNRLANFLSFGMLYNMKEVLDHELGHYYMDKLNESKGGGDWTSDNPGITLISEGIAQYFSATMNNKEDIYNKWPETIFDWNIVDIYEGGCHLVKPIVDKYGQKGIECLMENPPALKDFDNLPAYQNRVLEKLANPMTEQEMYEEQDIQGIGQQ